MINELLKSKILNYYREGSDLELIAYVLKISIEDILDIVRKFKKDSKVKNSYTAEFQKLVAERDRNGISRHSIKKELEMHENTIRKFCELYGVVKKEKSTESDEEFKVFSKGELGSNCPKCNSKRFNSIFHHNDNEKYCMDCGNEFRQFGNNIYILGWEYID